MAEVKFSIIPTLVDGFLKLYIFTGHETELEFKTKMILNRGLFFAAELHEAQRNGRYGEILVKAMKKIDNIVSRMELHNEIYINLAKNLLKKGGIEEEALEKIEEIKLIEIGKQLQKYKILEQVISRFPDTVPWEKECTNVLKDDEIGISIVEEITGGRSIGRSRHRRKHKEYPQQQPSKTKTTEPTTIKYKKQILEIKCNGGEIIMNPKNEYRTTAKISSTKKLVVKAVDQLRYDWSFFRIELNIQELNDGRKWRQKSGILATKKKALSYDIEIVKKWVTKNVIFFLEIMEDENQDVEQNTATDLKANILKKIQEADVGGRRKRRKTRKRITKKSKSRKQRKKSKKSLKRKRKYKKRYLKKRSKSRKKKGR